MVTRSIAMLLLCASGAFAQDGFRPLFNGKDLSGWDGQKGFWRATDGVLEGAPEMDGDKIPSSTYLIWKEGKVNDFHLRFKTRLMGGNSGVQYRSWVPNGYNVRGYQAEISSSVIGTGFLHQEGHRGIQAMVGQSCINGPQGNGQVVGQVSEPALLMKQKYYVPGEWVDYDIIVRGNHFLHFVGGRPTIEYLECDVVEQDLKRPGRLDEGILALQLHSGSYMKVQFKDFRLKTYPHRFGDALRIFNDEDLSGWKQTENGWSVKQAKGYKALAAGGKGELRSEKSLGEGILRMQVRPGKAALLKIGLGDQANVELTPALAKGLPADQWSDIEIVFASGRAEVSINQQALRTTEASTSGPVNMVGSEIEVRNLVAIPLRR